ncbi:MAG: response regulator [Prolixibacteraceae bacterium]|jgi:PAS domain S-box-containing protein
MIKILAIDDHHDNLVTLKAILQDAFPYAVLFTALNGLKGIELAITNDPDVILLDVVMPDMDGFEVCRRLKADDRVSGVPVIFLTALGGDRKSRFKALEVGADAFLSKPIDEAELTAQIKAMIIIKKHYQQQKDEKQYLNALIAERTQALEKELRERKQAEELLYQSNELTNSMLHTIPFGMDIVDEEGNILFISDNLKSLCGEDALKQKCWNLYRDDKIQCCTCPLKKGITVRETSLYETNGILGGKTFQISHTGMIYKGKKAMLEIFQDITEKKESEKRIQLLAHSLESISECVTVTDKEDTIIYVNKSFLNTYGYTLDGIIGQPTSILRAPDIEYEHVRNILPQTIEGGWRGEIMNRRKDGTLFPILLSTSIIRDDSDNPIALIGVAIDITDMRKSRQELIEAKELAEESNNLKTAFLNNMSHEIRTPMNHIMGFAGLMSEADSNEKDSYAEIILKSSNQLLSLIENVIQLSRLQSEKIPLEVQEFKPADLIANVIRNFESYGLKNGNSLRSEIPDELLNLSVFSDLEKIKQILVNLTTNSLTYTFQGRIQLGFHVDLEEITFLVKDTGIGIPHKEQEKIFDSFFRGENVLSLVIGGTGLGLSIVKKLVESMNGRINVESELGKGSAFSFTVPLLYISDAKHRFEEKDKFRKMSELAILIVDDEMVNCLYLEILLRNSVKSVDHANNGKIALEMVWKNSYDLIIMDLRMPWMDGLETTFAIKKEFPNKPIIALTAFASTEDMEKAKAAGCDEFIAKPVKKEVIFDAIRKYCH